MAILDNDRVNRYHFGRVTPKNYLDPIWSYALHWLFWRRFPKRSNIFNQHESMVAILEVGQGYIYIEMLKVKPYLDTWGIFQNNISLPSYL